MNEQRKWTIVWMTIAVFVTIAAFLPGLVHTGNLAPSNPPGSTMKTLDEVPPTWSRNIAPSKRFELVLPVIISIVPVVTVNYEGVLDKETGLVWEKSPDTTARDGYDACYYCYTKEVGGRKGWRLPTVEELASLVDTANTNPALPTGHPFSNVQSYNYWASGKNPYEATYAWYVNLYNGYVSGSEKSNCYHYVWCVRGGHGYDAY